MSEEVLKTRIDNLRKELERKELENHEFLDRIDVLEETVMRLESLIPEETSSKKKSKKKRAIDSKLAIELDERTKQVRALKNKMGVLRKEKIQFQRELEQISREKNSKVIRVEDLRSQSPLNVLVKELQEKVNKQRSLILQFRSKVADSDKINEKLKAKDGEIELLKSDLLQVNQKLKDLTSSSENKKEDSISKKLIDDLQSQLNKSKKQVIDLKQKLSKFSKKELNEGDTSKFNGLKQEINELKDQLESRNKESENLRNEITTLQKAEIAANFEPPETSENFIKALKEDLQKKLNKAKIQINSLKDQLKNASQKDPDGDLKMQRDLQKQLETKEGELETIKNEAVQIKRRYRQLENQLKLKDQKLNELQGQINDSNLHKQKLPRKEDPQANLRLRELKLINDNLKKENIEQRIEISQLRKKV